MNMTILAYSLVRDFGLAIIIVTVRDPTCPLSLYVVQIRSQLAPCKRSRRSMAELKKKYGKDRQRFSQEQMKLYSERV